MGSLFVAHVSAQPTISLSTYRDDGYSLGSDINGQFTVTAHVSSGVVRVEFYLNGTLQQSDTSSPFTWAFNTNSYPLGHANITAVAYDSSGQQATAFWNPNFVETPAWANILLILVIVVSIVVVAVGYKMRRNSGKSKLVKCPSCGNVFTPSVGLSLVHVGASQLRKCPKCGKTFFGGNLQEAPKTEETTPTSDTLTLDERLKRDIEKSKYEDKA
jgi:ribosomal protein L32